MTTARCLLCALILLLSSCTEKKAASPTAELIIYTPHPIDLRDPVLLEFRRRTGIACTAVSAGTGELIARLQAEKRSGGRGADVFWGGGIESLEAASDLFEPYTSMDIPFIDEVSQSPKRLYQPFSVMTLGIVYNTRLVSAAEAPKSWKDLADPLFRGRLIMADPELSGSAYSIIRAILQAEPDPLTVLGRLKSAAGSSGIAPSWAIVPAVSSGGFFAGLCSEDAALKSIDAGAPVSFVYPASGSFAVPDGVALVAESPLKDAAALFIDFVLSHDAQAVMSEESRRRSVRRDLKPPDRALPLSDIGLLPFSTGAGEKEAVLALWQGL